jgi:3,4-dihydroxy 2-butanone 4-phosphate synthase/GTP cyclohydrolase II
MGLTPHLIDRSSTKNRKDNVDMVPQIDLQTIGQKADMSASEVAAFLELVKRSMQPFSKQISVIENGVKRYYSVERRGIGVLNTEHGKFWEYSFAIDDQWKKYSVIIKAELDPGLLVPVFHRKDQLVLRTDSGCETGQVFNDLTCECNEQLHLAMKTLNEVGEGMIINIPSQDGRGMGLTFKLATLWIQDVMGVNTVESASMLAPGGVIDIRTYSGVICILKFFGISEEYLINLATNNPKKAEVFAENGYRVSDYIPIVIEPNHFTRKHLRAKQDHLGHKGLISQEVQG